MARTPRSTLPPTTPPTPRSSTDSILLEIGVLLLLISALRAC